MNIITKPAVVIAGYNRIDSISRLMRSVSNAYYDEKDIPLIVSIDHSEVENDIIDAIQRIGWTHGELVFRTFKERLGLRNHILSCGDLSRKYGSIIVLEDDLYLSRNYYSYVKQMLSFYQDDNRICGISLYSHAWNGYGNYQFTPQRNEYDVFIGQIGVSWGQCWTDRQWTDFKDWYELNKEQCEFGDSLPFTLNEWGDQSWAKYFYKYMVEQNKYYVIPYTSLSTNFSEVGEHSSSVSTTYQVPLLDADNKHYSLPTFEKAIKYDMFFERVLDGMMINGVSGEDICVNINGFKRSALGKQYLITCKNYKGINKIKSYGIRLRPIEENVIRGIPGEDIFLYRAEDINKQEIQNYRRTTIKRCEYEVYGNPVKRLEYYTSYKNCIRDDGHLDLRIWDDSFGFEVAQRQIEILFREQPVNGYTWMFHNVSNEGDWDEAEYAITPDTFERLIRNRLDRHYRFKDINRVMDKGDETCLYLTFDDAYKGVCDYVMPLCIKYNIPFSVFVTIDCIEKEKYIGYEDLLRLSKCPLCTIGAHTISHSKLRLLSEEAIKHELLYSKLILEGLTKRDIDVLAYPFGSFSAIDKRCFDIAKECGYKMAFSTINSHNINIEDARYFLPRINVNEEVADFIIGDLYEQWNNV